MSESKPVETRVGKRSSANRLKRRLDKDTTLEDLLDGWTQCCYLVPRKLKLCNVARTEGTLYCGNHQPVSNAEEYKQMGETSADKKFQERVPCPIDDNHSVYKHNLRYHLTVCTKKKQNNAMLALPYYRANCNSYDTFTTLCTPCDVDNQDASACTAVATFIDPQVLANKVQCVYTSIMGLYSKDGKANAIQEGGHQISALSSVATTVAVDTTDRSTMKISSEATGSELKIADLALADKITAKLGQDLKSQRKLRHVDQDILIVEQMVRHGLIRKKGARGGDNDSVAVKDATTATSDTAAAVAPESMGSTSAMEVTQTTVSTVSTTPAVYVELGAGRGLLSYAVSCADPSATVVLVERSGSRKKVDKALKDDFAHLRDQLLAAGETDVGVAADAVVEGVTAAGAAPPPTGAIIRARMDIRHCWLPSLPGVNPPSSGMQKEQVQQPQQQPQQEQQPVVVIAKHLCGVATDLAIHSVRAFPHIPNTLPVSHPSQSNAGVRSDHAVGIAIATCCHHACQFEDYAGKEWFLAQGFTQAEFEVLKKWSGWANSVNLNLNTSATAGGAVTGDESSIALPEDNVADAGIGAGAGAVEGVNNKANVNVSAQDLTEQQQEQRNSVEVEEGNDHQAPLSAQVVRPENITPAEMQLLGWQVKRIFDHGRVEYINKYYRMSARQIRYCERHLSPECVMIVATEL